MNYCRYSKRTNTCKRRNNGIMFQLPRRFTRRRRYPQYAGSMRHKAVAVLSGKVKGVVRFLTRDEKTTVKYDITGLKDGLHGFHVHKCGDLTKGCVSGCEHFNPNNNGHGGRTGSERHAGDLGNIRSRNGRATGSFTAVGISVNPITSHSVVGRMVIVHADEDDLGKGRDTESAITGNAGERLACGVIGIAR